MTIKIKTEKLTDNSDVHSVEIGIEGKSIKFDCVDAGHAKRLFNEINRVVDVTMEEK